MDGATRNCRTCEELRGEWRSLVHVVIAAERSHHCVSAMLAEAGRKWHAAAERVQIGRG